MATKLSKMASPELKKALIDLRQFVNQERIEDNLDMMRLSKRATEIALSMGEDRRIRVVMERGNNASTHLAIKYNDKWEKEEEVIFIKLSYGIDNNSSGVIDAILAHELAHHIAKDLESRKSYRRSAVFASSAAAVAVMAGESYLGHLGIPRLYAHYLGTNGVSFETLLSGIGTYSVVQKAMRVAHLANMRKQELRADRFSVSETGEINTVKMLLRLSHPDVAHSIINDILDEERVKSEVGIISRTAGYAAYLYGRVTGFFYLMNNGTHPSTRKRVENALKYSRLARGEDRQ
jgi:hypothetical protein